MGFATTYTEQLFRTHVQDAMRAEIIPQSRALPFSCMYLAPVYDAFSRALDFLSLLRLVYLCHYTVTVIGLLWGSESVSRSVTIGIVLCASEEHRVAGWFL